MLIKDKKASANETPMLGPWLWYPFLVCLAMSTVSTKMGGAGWLLMVLLGLFFAVFGKSREKRESLDLDVLQAARVWLLACGVAIGVKAIGVVYWGDPVGTRHFDIRLILGAIAIYFFVARVRLGEVARRQLLVALLMAAGIGFVVSYLHASYQVPTPSNRINWAGGLVMLSWVMMSAAACIRLGRNWQRAAVLGFVVVWLAVLMSGARAAYLSLPWAMIVGVMLLVARTNAAYFVAGRWLLMIVFGAAAVGTLLTVTQPSVVHVPVDRVTTAVRQAEDALGLGENREIVVNTPVGARIYMWQRSLEVIKKSPWLGYGREQRMAFVKMWGQEVQSHIVESQTHLHSEYINGMVDHGVLGLISTLAYMTGLVWVAMILRRRHGLMALAVAGIAFTHVTMSITDANSQTNNYSVMMNMALMAIFLFRFNRIRETTEGTTCLTSSASTCEPRRSS